MSKAKQPTKASRLKVLRSNLHFYQMQARIELRWLKQSRAKCMEIGAQMRKVQAEK